MAGPGALYVALDLAANPRLAAAMQRQALPPDVLDVIKIAAGSPQTCRQAEKLTGKKPDFIRQAAILYLQNILFASSADNYRVLGVAREAPSEEIRQHMRWLMKWLHPDRAPNQWDSAFAERVLGAWDELKSPARRAEYDRSLPPTKSTARSRSRRQRYRRVRIPWVKNSSTRTRPSAPSGRHWLVAAIGLGVAMLAILAVSAEPRQGSDTRLGGSSVDVNTLAPAFDKTITP